MATRHHSLSVVSFACTFVEKTVEESDYDTGATGKTFTTMAERVSLTAPTLKELIEAIGKQFGLVIDDLFIPGDEPEPVTSFGFNRYETVDGQEPSAAQRAAWKGGKLTVWLANYFFSIEKRVTKPITLEDVEATGLKTH